MSSKQVAVYLGRGWRILSTKHWNIAGTPNNLNEKVTEWCKPNKIVKKYASSPWLGLVLDESKSHLTDQAVHQDEALSMRQTLHKNGSTCHPWAPRPWGCCYYCITLMCEVVEKDLQIRIRLYVFKNILSTR